MVNDHTHDKVLLLKNYDPFIAVVTIPMFKVFKKFSNIYLDQQTDQLADRLTIHTMITKKARKSTPIFPLLNRDER